MKFVYKGILQLARVLYLETMSLIDEILLKWHLLDASYFDMNIFSQGKINRC